VTLKNVQRGSHRKAVHHNATLFPCPRREKNQIKNLVSVVSWIGFLASAVSEYGLDVDFPLSPALWLAIAFCVMFATVGHAVVSDQIHGIGKRETGTYLSGAVPSLSDSVSFINPGHKSPRISDRCRGICQDSCRVTGDGAIRMNLGDASITASDAMPAAIFMSPATTRGPPWASEQSTYLFGGTLGRPARHFYTAPLPSETHLHDSSTAPNAFLNSTDQTSIRSAIEGDQT
jgi:hypothetical protein